jgi:hypothetical protein
MTLPANRPDITPAAPKMQRRWWSRSKPVVVGPADSAELELGYESAQPWLLRPDLADAAPQIELPR